jgi:hypothetical protein
VICRLTCLPFLVVLMAVGCSDDGPSGRNGASDVETRGFRMGFSAFPPRPNEADYLRAVDLWIQRADAAILHESVPWAALLAGTPAETAVRALILPLVQGYRGRGLDVVFTIDVTNGVDRTSEDPGLVALGRSITEPEVQQVYRDCVLAVARVLQPSYLGLAAETNLTRLAAPRPVYDGVVTMTNAASRDLTAAGVRVPLYVSAQVETAWGKLAGGGAFVGIETDLRDCPLPTSRPGGSGGSSSWRRGRTPATSSSSCSPTSIWWPSARRATRSSSPSRPWASSPPSSCPSPRSPRGTQRSHFDAADTHALTAGDCG